MSNVYYTDTSRRIFCENLWYLRFCAESDVYASLCGTPTDLDAVLMCLTNVTRHGDFLGFTSDYIVRCLRFAFEAGIRAAVTWVDENNVTTNPHILDVLKLLN